ncbi:MAG: 3-oxoacid CoA-transferase [Chloroflexota bacterium]
MNKVFPSPEAAVEDIEDGATIAFAGFGVAHRFPSSLMAALLDSHAKDLCLVSNTLGGEHDVRRQLVDQGRVRKLIVSFSATPGNPTLITDMVDRGEIELELVPQGTLMERCRAAGAGIPAFFTPTGAGTRVTEDKDRRYFDGRPYVMERWLPLDYAFIRAERGDPLGNLHIPGSSLNFSPSFAKAARTAIAEVDEVVSAGDLPPNLVNIPGILIGRVVRKTIDIKPFGSGAGLRRRPGDSAKMYLGKRALTRAQIAQRAARLLPEGSYVNLGIGIPTMVSNYLAGHDVTLHAENGLLGYGEIVPSEQADPDVYNAGGQFVALKPGASFFESIPSFEMARSGKLTAVILGAYEVDQHGNLASWTTSERGGGIGGSMDLVAGSSTLIIAMEHRDSRDRAKVVRACHYDLTGAGCVDYVVTDLALLHSRDGRLVLEETAPGFTPAEVVQLTEAELTLAPRVGTMLATT